MINDLTFQQKNAMAIFMFSVISCNQRTGYTMKTGESTPGDHCIMGGQTRKGLEIFTCMAVAHNLNQIFGITFEGEFLFYDNQTLIRGFPIV